MKPKHYLLGLAIAMALFGVKAVPASAACINPTAVSGFAAPCPVLSLSATSTTATGTISVIATPGTRQYVHQTFYLWNGSNWQSQAFNGNFKNNYASTTVSSTLTSSILGSLPSGTIYVASWDWTYSTSSNCFTGPSSTTCGSGFWRLQSFQLSGGGSNGGGDDNRYCGPGNVPNFGTSDGPAQLPQACFYTALSATPSPGSVVSVPPGTTVSALQTMINNLSCGQTMQFQAGASYDVTGLNFPAKNCDNGHWITIETSAVSQLPPEGTRVSPCWAGVASLPGRPPYACPAGGPQNVMAQWTMNANNAITVQGDHYRFRGLEVTRAPGTTMGQIVTFTNQFGSYLIYDHMWIHGDATHDSQHAMQNNDANHIALIDSYVNDYHCIAGLLCTDSQAFSGSNNQNAGDTGVFKVVNNFLEAAGENILFGGGPSADSAPDLEIRRNDMFKPMSWNPADPSYLGIKMLVKNGYEMKNGQRGLVEGNIIQNIWAGYSQKAPAISLGPKNQSSVSNATSVCPLCLVKNMTVRYNVIRNVGQAMAVIDAMSGTGGWATEGNHDSIHDNIFDGISYPECQGGCGVAQNEISSGQGDMTNPPPASDILHDISINHNTEVMYQGTTAVPDDAAIVMAGYPSSTGLGQYNISITNNIFSGGIFGAMNAGGGTSSCAVGPGMLSPLGKFNSCWNPYQFAGNLISGGLNVSYPTWPAGNTFPADYPSIGFVNLNGGQRGDYHLSASSPYKNSATDGTDPGANVDLVNAATAGVE